MKKYTIDNLDCPMCAAKIEEGIKNLSCVKDAKVVFATKTLLIDTDNISKVQKEIKKIEKDVVINEKKVESEFNVKNELILLFVLLIAFGFGIYLLHNVTTFPYSYSGFAMLLLVYFTAGKDVIIKSVKNIIRGKIFDENFLMTFATMAAWGIKSYSWMGRSTRRAPSSITMA